MNTQMHPEDIQDEQHVAAMKTAINAALIPEAKMTMKVYALLETAIALCTDDDVPFLEDAFNEVINMREMIGELHG